MAAVDGKDVELLKMVSSAEWLFYAASTCMEKDKGGRGTTK